MTKILNYLIGIFGILYMIGQISYYAIVQYLKLNGLKRAEIRADDYKVIFDWVIFMAFLLLITGGIALIVNLVKFQAHFFVLRLIFNLLGILMPFMHIKNEISVMTETVFLVLFGLYLFQERKLNLNNKSSKN